MNNYLKEQLLVISATTVLDSIITSLNCFKGFKKTEKVMLGEIQCFKPGLVSVDRGNRIHLKIRESLFAATRHFNLSMAFLFFNPIGLVS